MKKILNQWLIDNRDRISERTKIRIIQTGTARSENYNEFIHNFGDTAIIFGVTTWTEQENEKFEKFGTFQDYRVKDNSMFLNVELFIE